MMCSQEEFLQTITIGYYPPSHDNILVMYLYDVSSMIVRTIHHDLYPREGTPLKPHFTILVAMYCILKKVEVN